MKKGVAQVRKRLCEGELSAGDFLRLDAAEVTLTEEQKRQRVEKREREVRATVHMSSTSHE